MTAIDPDTIKVILATDCGSTTTKAILIQLVDGEYRQTHRGEAPSTVEEPFADVTIGVINAVTEVSELAGRALVNDEGRIIQPATANTGCDIYISTSSAGGGLQMLVAGVVRQMTAESAKRAALGAGAIVMDVIASNDQRRPHDQIQRIRELRPGDVFGEIAFLLKQPRSMDVYATADGCRVLSLSETLIRKMIENDPAIAAQLLLNISKMLCLRVIQRG